MVCTQEKPWVAVSSITPSTAVLKVAMGSTATMSLAALLKMSSTSPSTTAKATALHRMNTSGRMALRNSKGWMREFATLASGALISCTAHIRPPNTRVSTVESSTSFTRRETPSARLNTAFSANMAATA